MYSQVPTRSASRPRILIFGNITQPPFVNNLIGVLRAFQRVGRVTCVEQRTLAGFVDTGGVAPAPLPVAATVAAVAGVQPDLVVCVAGAIFVPPEVKAVLPSTAVYTGLALSDPLGLPVSLAIASHFDLYYTHDPTSMPAYREAGVAIRECAPAIDGELFRPLGVDKDCDVLFAGKWTSGREGLIRDLRGVGSVRVLAHPWENRWEAPTEPSADTPESLCAAFNRARLCLEFAVIDDFPPPAEGTWRLTNRPQFAAACGVPSIIEANPLLARYFESDREILAYRNRRDLLTQVRDLLAEPERLAEMGRRARARVLRDHLWDQRVEMLLGDARAYREGKAGW